MSISFEFENTLSPESPIYPLIADLSGTVTLYFKSTLYKSKDFPIEITVDSHPEEYFIEVTLISNHHRTVLNRDVPYNTGVMKCLESIEKVYVTNTSKNRYHPLYQLLESASVNTDYNMTPWRDYTLILSTSIHGNTILIALNDRIIYQFKNYNIDYWQDLIKKLIDNIDKGLADELLVRPPLSKSARKIV
jgi:hypothetical protein